MRYFLEIQYDGAPYHGWQRQPNALSVQEVLEGALSTLLRTPTEVVGSGRTDTGVHCMQQFAHLDIPSLPMGLGQLQHRLNAFLPHAISIPSIRPVQPDAHARFSALWRRYRYQVHQSKNPFLHTQSYFFYHQLNIERMNEAGALLCQYRNFRPFSKTHTDVKTFFCEVTEARWEKLDNGQLIFHIQANRFLRGMVRLITGALLQIGTGKMTCAALKAWLDAEQPVNHRHSAPAHGLYLSEVAYDKAIFLPSDTYN